MAQATAHSDSAQENSGQYTHDIFIGMAWWWEYGGYDGRIYNLAPHRPHCDRTLELSNGRHHPEGTFLCREHGVIHRTHKRYDDFGEIIKEEIRVKPRNGSWKSAV